MAIVFISPKQRQKTFFMGITIVVLLFVAIIALSVFFAKPKEIAPELIFNKPKVNINLKALDSEQFKELEPFSEMEVQFSYSAVTEKRKNVTGIISAVSEDAAAEILKSMDLTVIEIKEVEIGRENPFTPYYETLPPPETKPKTKAR